ncbi:unnamed protein product [Onchocerca ochengi]|uniref:Uncharacterized protein n=1 Tax=Onchocerca ochengi TaxID=42157 RepID=A0A182EV97_ONCOC|nr:unnamed protein product [Onchocerca ochengi]
MVTYRSFDTVVEADEAVNYPTEYLPGMPPDVLQLKIGVPIFSTNFTILFSLIFKARQLHTSPSTLLWKQMKTSVTSTS